MRDALQRREALGALSTAVAGGLAGCSGLLGNGGNGGDPDATPTGGACQDTRTADAGTGSYGILVYNKLDERQEVSFTVEAAWDDEEYESLGTTVDGNGGCREWDNVITESKEHAITAKMGYVRGLQHDEARHFITPGAADAPDVENVAILLEMRTMGYDDRAPWIFITTDPAEIPENSCDDNC